jgi:hypothetical protein
VKYQNKGRQMYKIRSTVKAVILSGVLASMLSGCGSSPMDDLTRSKWSVGDLACDTNGGAYTKYGEQYVLGSEFTANGKVQPQTTQKTWKEFSVGDDGIIKLHTKIYAEGNAAVMKFVSGETLVSETVTMMKIDGDKLIKNSVGKMINVSKLLNDGAVDYKDTAEESVSNRCAL